MQDQLVTQSMPTAPSWRPSSSRPSRGQVEPIALSLLARHSAGLLATARRYSASPEDAEDAYQRGVEILLTKAPATSEDELLPWLRTVVKHEAFALRKSNGRAEPMHAPGASEPDPGAWTEDRAERYERLRVGAEALAKLKPQEIRCLLLRAEGLSYKEICDATGWTYTKVNRSITEGRRAFLERVASIEAGAECERLAPLISKAADGEASADELQRLRPHLKTCLACKATLREYRATPGRLAGLVPPVIALAGAPGGGSRLGMFVARAAQALHDRFGAFLEPAAAQKAAAVAASAAVLAGGGAAGVAVMREGPATAPAAGPVQRHEAAPARSDRGIAADPVPPAGTTVADPAPTNDGSPKGGWSSGSAESAKATPRTDGTPHADPTPEFDPGTPTPGSATAGAPSSTADAPSPAPTTTSSAPAPASNSSPSPAAPPASGPAEFTP